MIRRRHCLMTPFLIALAGCAAPAAPVVDNGPPIREPLYSPEQVRPGRLEYAPDRSTFAPVLTERFPYPTQPEANAAYRRLLAVAPTDRAYPVPIWLLGARVPHGGTHSRDRGGGRGGGKRATSSS